MHKCNHQFLHNYRYFFALYFSLFQPNVYHNISPPPLQSNHRMLVSLYRQAWGRTQQNASHSSHVMFWPGGNSGASDSESSSLGFLKTSHSIFLMGIDVVHIRIRVTQIAAAFEIGWGYDSISLVLLRVHVYWWLYEAGAQIDFSMMMGKTNVNFCAGLKSLLLQT